ncbi:MAG: MATE family efflux transporter [Pirellulales bacterium]|nr:MATE family efflux transporter [Pirellulales bacterium]
MHQSLSPAPSPITAPGPILPVLARLALPILAVQILDMLVGMTDSWLAGTQLGRPEHLAAMNLVNYCLWFLISIFSLVSIGTTAIVARSIGAGEYHEARRIANVSLFWGGLLCLVPMLGLYFFSRPVVELLGLHGTAAELAARYFLFLIPALPAMMIESVGGGALRAAGDTFSPMLSMVAVNAIDMLVSFGLVVGLGPFPQLGWDGLVIGTVAGYGVGVLIMLWAMNRGTAGLKIIPAEIRWDAARAWRIFSVGIPGGIDLLAMIGCHLWFMRVINDLGEVSAAAHGVAIRLESLSYLPVAALQVAATTMVGQNLGAGQPARATRSVWIACLVGEAFLILSCAILFFGNEFLARMFVKSDQPEVIAQAARALRIVTLAQPGLVILMILTGALRGAGDTRWPLLVTFVGFLLVRIPLGTALAHSSLTLPWMAQSLPLLGWGLSGAWYAMVIDIYVRTALVVWRFSGGKWKKARV